MDEEVILSLANVLNFVGVLHILVIELSGEICVLKDSVRNLSKLDLISDDDDRGLNNVSINIENQLVSTNVGVSRDGPGGSRVIDLDL